MRKFFPALSNYYFLKTGEQLLSTLQKKFNRQIFQEMAEVDNKQEEWDYFALYSRRLEKTISGCRVRAKLASEKLVFHIEGDYYPRFVLDSATRKLKDEEEDLEIHALFSESRKLKVGFVPLKAATHDDFEKITDEDEQSQQEAGGSESDSSPNSKDAENDEPEAEAVSEGEVIAVDGADEVEVYLEPKMSEERKRKLVLENLEAQGDSSIESDESDQDSKDEELAQKFDASSSQDPDDENDPDVADQFANIEKKIFQTAPRKFTIDIKSTLNYFVTLSKNLEFNCFKLEKIEIPMDGDLREALNRKKLQSPRVKEQKAKE